MTRYTTTGNSRPHIVQDGYRNAPRVNGPLERTPPLDTTSWPTWIGICVAISAAIFLYLVR